MTLNKYGFIINDSEYPIEISETTEKKATIKFINKYWSRINDKNLKPLQSIRIEILGKLIKIK